MMKLLKETRAQGTLEYIVLIGGALIVAAIIAIALKQAANTLGNRASEQTADITE